MGKKGEIACNKHFFLISQCFLPLYDTYFSPQMHFKMSSAICFNLDQSKILSSGNGLDEPEKEAYRNHAGIGENAGN